MNSRQNSALFRDAADYSAYLWCERLSSPKALFLFILKHSEEMINAQEAADLWGSVS